MGSLICSTHGSLRLDFGEGWFRDPEGSLVAHIWGIEFGWGLERVMVWGTRVLESQGWNWGSLWAH